MAAKKCVRESQEQTGILKFFNTNVRDKEQKEISEDNQSESGDGEQGEACSAEEVVLVADLIPANFPKQDLDKDILIKPNMFSVKITSAISSLSPGRIIIVNIVLHHFVPSPFTFPKVFDCGCIRSFQATWLEKYRWLVYS